MADATAASIRSRFATLVRDRSNNGIRWGRNNPPDYEFTRDEDFEPNEGTYTSSFPLSYFQGDTGGISTLPSTSAMMSGDGSLDASAVVEELLRVTRIYARIKRVRIRIDDYVEEESCTSERRCAGGEGGCAPETIRRCSTVYRLQTDVYDETGIAHTRNDDASHVSAPGLAGVRAGTAASWSQIETYLNRLWNNLSDARSDTHAIRIQNCHSSCHSACHSQTDDRVIGNPGPGGPGAGSGPA